MNASTKKPEQNPETKPALTELVLAISAKPSKSDGDGFKRPAWTTDLYELLNDKKLTVSEVNDNSVTFSLDNVSFDVSIASLIANSLYYPASKGCSFNEHLKNMSDEFLTKHQRSIAESDENQPLQARDWDFITDLGFHFPQKAKGGVIIATFAPRAETQTPEQYKEAFFTGIQSLNSELLTMGYNPVKPEINKDKKEYFVTIKKAKKVDFDDFDL